MSVSQELVIVQMDGEPRIDSRLVASSLGIEHRSMIKLLYTYENELQELGSLRFSNRSQIRETRRGTT